MKKSLLALAALTAFAGAASAQSSVTLFGVVDLNARNVKNDTLTQKSLSTDGNSSSRLGFRGVEDIGGGVRAGFWLEAGLSADNGTTGGGNGGATANQTTLTNGGAVNNGTNCTANTTTGAITCPPGGTPGANSSTSGAFFNRRATVSLLGGFGEIRLGRDYTPSFWNHTVFDVFGTNGVASATNIISVAPTVAPLNRAQTLVRANNSVGYFLPSLGGVYGQIMIAAGEKQNPSNKYVGGRIGYAGGPVNVAVSYGKTDREWTMEDDMTAISVGGSFNLGFLTIMGQVHKYEEGRNELTNFSVGVAVPFGASTLKASYGKTDRSFSPSLKPAALATGVEPSATQIGLGYTYDLSKRTTVYTHFSRVANDAGLAFTAGVGGLPRAANGFKFDSTGYEFGLRHSF